MNPVRRSRRAARARPAEVVVIVRAKSWRRAVPGAVARCRRAAMSALAAAGRARKACGRHKLEIAIVLASDAFVAKLNHDYRGKRGPTNVLSFPSGMTETVSRGEAVPLGDIVIAFETARREAKAAEKPLSHHLAHLVVHGTLHLLGYDHEKEREAVHMEGLETEILRAIGIADPYRPQRAAKVA